MLRNPKTEGQEKAEFRNPNYTKGPSRLRFPSLGLRISSAPQRGGGIPWASKSGFYCLRPAHPLPYGRG